MRVNVVVLELLPKVAPYFVELNTTSGFDFQDNLLYIPLPRRMSPYHLDSLVTEIPSSLRRLVNSVIIRAHKEEARQLLDNNQIADRLYHRFEQRPIRVLHWRNDRFVLQELAPRFQRVLRGTAGDFSDGLRHCEFAGIISKPGVLLPSVSDYHYEGPNGVHYKSFIRLGVALTSLDTLDAATFWLLPHILSHDLVLFDSASILPLGLNFYRYKTELKLQARDSMIRLECIRDYNEPSEDVIHRLESLVKDIHGSRLLFICSVCSRGKLSKRITSDITKIGIRRLTNISLFAVSTAGAPAGEIFCTLDQEFAGLDPDNCTPCAKNVPTVRLESTSFQVVSAAVQEVRIGRSDATNAKDFVERYAGTNAISIHRNQHDQARHHMIHIDVATLANTKVFHDRLQVALEPFKGNVDLILSPPHEAATTLARKSADLLGGIRSISCEESHLQTLSWEQQEALKCAKNILVIDDVIITGNRLRGYKQFLNRGKLLRHHAELKCLVGVARPSGNNSLQSIADMFHSKNNFRAVETLLLPDWREAQCPWCNEFARIELLGERLRDSVLMRERHERLSKTNKGLTTDLFLPWTRSDGTSWRLGPQSVFADLGFGEVNEVELFIAVASTIQTLRDKRILNDQFTAPICKVLASEYFLTGRYYAPVILASILRASHRHDLRSDSTDSKQRSAVLELLNSESANIVRAEIFFAISQDKLPKAKVIQEGAAFASCDSGVRLFLKHQLGLI